MHRPVAAVLAALLVCASPLAAQVEVPALKWRTIETRHFRLHYEPGLEAWTQDVARHLESIREAVAARVDYANPRKIDLIIEDPFNVPNGNAWPSLVQPAMRFWATPPAPSSVLGHSRGWGEILSVHEYAHLAHLTRPSRQPFAGLIAALGGLPVGPLVFSPAWVTEGYATVIEGELTGAGRPNGVARPAILRQLALEGYLPSYGDLNGTERFNGGSMRYLVGSAYLEWLQEQRGDSALPQLWRRMTARESRSFDEAFQETFGDPASVLYGRFAADLLAKSHEARKRMAAAGMAKGSLAQHWNWYVGPPAVSPDGKLIAVRRSSAEDGARLLILNRRETAGNDDSTKIAERLERDPLDLAPYRPYPRALKVEHKLAPTAGAAYDNPRWFRDGQRLLVTRSVPRADGRIRPDLFLWQPEFGSIRRVTKAAGIVVADPFPDGRRAAALTCGGGTCGLVIVDLADGSLRDLAAGEINRAYHGVRVSADGRRVATARQRGADWEIVVIDAERGSVQRVGPDDGATRHSPSWESDSTLIVVSEASGVPSLERIHLDQRPAVVVARTTGIATAPDVGPDGAVWWLDMHARGYDLRVTEAGTRVAALPPLDSALYPATRRVSRRLARDFAAQPLPEPRRYGIGPFSATVIGGNSAGADGYAWSMGVNAGDPLSRLGVFAVAGTGTHATWSGARGVLTWRGLPVDVQLQGWNAIQDVSDQGRLGGPGATPFDWQLSGWLVALHDEWHAAHGVSKLRVGYASATLELRETGGEFDRTTLFTEFSSQQLFTPTATTRLDALLAASLAQGSFGPTDFRRVQGEVALSFAHNSGAGLGGRIKAGYADSKNYITELFVIGGTPSLFLDPAVLDQRVAYPGLPIFGGGIGQRYAIISAETPGPLRLYHDWISAGVTGYGRPTRVLGGELRVDVPRISVFRLPAGAVRVGVSHALNGFARNATVAYGTVVFTP